MASPYNAEFFAARSGGSRMSAEAILPEVLLESRSVVDVGCGTGTWLAVACEHGISDVLGVDGPWVSAETLEIPVEQFRQADLRQPFRADRTFDLALSLETAEHLPPDRAAGFVADLVALASIVLFSAAIPGQGGTDHLNEEWPDYWANLFARHGYRQIDAIRWAHWEDETIDPWYVQNAYLYAAAGRPVNVVERPMPVRVVHPGTLEWARRTGSASAGPPPRRRFLRR